jgi:pyridoxal phosphate enzyme (YggS family)
MSDDLATRLAAIRDRIERARVAANAGPVELVGVSKLHPPEAIEEALAAGLLVFGENYAQELEEKRRRLVDPRIRWHMIGPVQSNKAKRVVGCTLVHTIDRPSIITALDRHAAAAGIRQDVLVQVNVVAELGKSGVPPAGLDALLDAFAHCTALRCVGLMLIPRPGSDDDVRAQFRALRQLRDAAAVHTPPGVELRELSMGMSDDFELAIAEGATIVRVGTAIFGARRPL